MDRHINNAAVAAENEYLHGGKRYIGSGSILRTYKDDSAKKAMYFLRKAVAQMAAPEKLDTVKDSVDRFKLERYFNDLETELANTIEAYVQGQEQLNTGKLIPAYNNLVIYLKNILNWKNLNETEKSNIDSKFISLLPQINEIMDITQTQDYTDKNEIKELYENVLFKDYQPIKYKSYVEKIVEKKGIYIMRDKFLNSIYDTLNNPDVYKVIKDAIKKQLDELIKLQDDYIKTKIKTKKNYLEKKIKEVIDDINKNIDEHGKKKSKAGRPSTSDLSKLITKGIKLEESKDDKLTTEPTEPMASIEEDIEDTKEGERLTKSISEIEDEITKIMFCI